MEYFYRVHSFHPPENPAPKHYSLNIWLDKNFAKQAFDKKLEKVVREHLIASGREIIKRTFPKDWVNGRETPYIFEEDSCLVRVLQVPGDACDLCLDISDIENIKKGKIDVRYTPHNVDTLLQQYALLSVFLNWAHTVKGLTSR